jgi:hypothetical protein
MGFLSCRKLDYGSLIRHKRLVGLLQVRESHSTSDALPETPYRYKAECFLYSTTSDDGG